MFDLKPGVHFHEIETAIFIDQKLDRASVFVADGFGELDRGISHFLPQRRSHDR